ncbi:Plectin-like protein [Phytophthora palmivora]|uniref:Plectin-like protein n=1 Tax=Phytophthora palmivora TaxID=4796 RepID=A0A2P4YLF8_9STRA|nr:Plectin-like protein [Phytophthora palmivora]
MKGVNQEDWDDDEPPMLGEMNEPDEGNQTAEENQDASIMDEMLAVAQRAKAEKRKQQDKERNSKSFGQGLKKGFFNSTKTTTKKKTTPAKDATTLEPREERLLVVKEKEEENRSTDSAFVFPEVQEAMKSMNQLDPKALQNPSFSKAIREMQQDPHTAILKYQKDPAVSTMLRDFMEFLGNHFEELGASTENASSEKKSERHPPSLQDLQLYDNQTTPRAPAIVDLDEARRQAIAGMQRTPEEEEQVQRILKNPELLAALSDGDLMQRLRGCQHSPGELQRVAQDPVLGPKLRLLVQHNMVQFAS